MVDKPTAAFVLSLVAEILILLGAIAVAGHQHHSYGFLTLSRIP